jgi:hypothetical protein
MSSHSGTSVKGNTLLRFLLKYWLEFGIKPCTLCGEYLSIDQFFLSARPGGSGFRFCCKTCFSKRQSKLSFSRRLRGYWLEYGICSCHFCGRYLDVSQFRILRGFYKGYPKFGYCLDCDKIIHSAAHNRAIDASKWERQKREQGRRWRKKYPEKRRELCKRAYIKSRKNLTDSYVKKLLVQKSSLSHYDIPSGLIEAKRQQLKLIREVRSS